jgi:uncharacterized protein (TIGR02271 family)
MSEREDIVRHEEELRLGTRVEEVGGVRARKEVGTEQVAQSVSREVEHVDDLERVPAGDHDSGEIETLPDGSISIPVFEEELVVTKRLVVRERVVVRKRTEVEDRRVEAELRKERLEIESTGAVDVEDDASS